MAPDIWGIFSTDEILLDIGDLNNCLPLDDDLTQIPVFEAFRNPNDNIKLPEDNIRLPVLDESLYQSLSRLPVPESPLLSLTDELPSPTEDDGPLWRLDFELLPAEEYFDVSHAIPFPESRKSAEDEVLSSQAKESYMQSSPTSYFPSPSTDLSRSRKIIHGLIHLSIGVESELFLFSEKRMSFEKAKNYDEETRLLSPQGSILHFIKVGNMRRRIQSFVEKIYNRPGQLPCLHALAGACALLLAATDSFLIATSSYAMNTDELELKLSAPCAILAAVDHLTFSAMTGDSDGDILPAIFMQIEAMAKNDIGLYKILRLLFFKTCQPYLELALQHQGLIQSNVQGSAAAFSTSFATFKNETSKISGREYDSQKGSDHRPNSMALFSHTYGQMLIDTAEKMIIVRRECPDHPLAKPDIQLSKALEHSLSQFTARTGYFCTMARDYALRIHGKVAKCTTRRADNIRSISSEPCLPIDIDISRGPYSEIFNLDIEEQTSIMNTINGNDILESDELYRLSMDYMMHGSENSPRGNVGEDCLTDQLSLLKPILETQSRLANLYVLQAIFHSGELLAHLQMQRAFHLLGDGAFMSSLSECLFSTPEINELQGPGSAASGDSADDSLHKTMDPWPPATSELRILLSALLSERLGHSMLMGKNSYATRDFGRLSSNFSFAIDQCSEIDSAICSDRNSLHAYDFLRISYEPPPLISMIVTPRNLQQYDSIFKFLLQLARVKFITSRLSLLVRSVKSLDNQEMKYAQAFHFEAHHFISQFAFYTFTTVIGSEWNHLEEYLAETIAQLQMFAEEENTLDIPHLCAEAIREVHGDFLIKILNSLMIEGHHGMLITYLHVIFTNILDFWRQMCHIKYDRTTVADSKPIQASHLQFTRNITAFLSHCSTSISMLEKDRTSVRAKRRQDSFGTSNLKVLLQALQSSASDHIEGCRNNTARSMSDDDDESSS